MGSVKIDVVYAWLKEQLEAGAMVEEDVLKIYNCENSIEWALLIRQAAEKVGDMAPIDILTGVVHETCRSAHC